MKIQSFTKEDLELILQALKDDAISGFNKDIVKASVFNKINEYEAKNRVPVLLSFRKHATIYKTVFASLIIAVAGYSGFRATANISPLSPFYPIKQNTDNIVISMLSEEKKIEKKLEITIQKLVALKSENISEQKSYQIAESVKQDLTKITADINNIKDPKKLLLIATTIESQTDILKKEALDEPTITTGNTLPADIKTAIEQTTSKILAIFNETQDKATNCPNYIATRIESLTANPELNFFNPSKYSEIVTLLKEAKTKIERNDCLGALANLETIESYKLNLVISDGSIEVTEQSEE